MKPWDQRPFEIRYLFNPAFCGLVLFHALRGYEKIDSRGMPFSLSLLILPLCLQKESREVLAKNNRSYFVKVIEMNPQIQVNFAERTKTLLPYALEGLGLLMEGGCLSVTDDGRLKTVSNKVRKSIKGTYETQSCQHVASFIGKEFARITDRVTIYMTLGVRP